MQYSAHHSLPLPFNFYFPFSLPPKITLPLPISFMFSIPPSLFPLVISYNIPSQSPPYLIKNKINIGSVSQNCRPTSLLC